MKPAKLDIAFAFTNYAGNGGIASTIPELRRWWGELTPKLLKDERIGRVWDMPEGVVNDTPITMSRNRCLREAKENGFDVLVFIDSDNDIDMYSKTDGVKEFFASSFDFVYKRMMNDIPTVIAAPYCGPPVHPTGGGEENVYVFKWRSMSSGDTGFTGAKLVAYDRDEAALMKGIQPAAALPTGACMITLNCLDAIQPPYFCYEWADEQFSKKASTEDVYFTRNISMAGIRKWNTPIVFCNWDCWAGHKKQKTVGKPEVMTVDHVNKEFAEAVRRDIKRGDEIRYIGFKRDGTVNVPQSLQDAIKADDEYKELGINCEPQRVTVNGQDFFYLGWLTNGYDTDAITGAIRSKFGDEEIFGVEVGSWVGYTATLLLDEFPNLSLQCVDTFEGSPDDVTSEIKRRAAILKDDECIIQSLFQKNTARFKGRVGAYAGTSKEAAEVLDGGVDFVFIDAGHSYEDCKADIETWLPKIREGGLLIGHDYGTDTFEGVQKAVDEAFGDRVHAEANVWWVDLAEETEPFEEDHAIKPGIVDGKRVEFDESIVSADDRNAIAHMMGECFGRVGREHRKVVYIGSPDPGTLDLMGTKARTFCVCNESDKRLKYALSFFEEDESVRFIRYTDFESVIYQDWWDDGDADIVFVEKGYACAEFIQRSFDLLSDNGILCGNGDPIEEAFVGTPIGRYGESGLWGIAKQSYIDAIESNGHSAAKVRTE